MSQDDRRLAPRSNNKCGPPDRFAVPPTSDAQELVQLQSLLARHQRECFIESEQLLTSRADTFACPRSRYVRSTRPAMGPRISDRYSANASLDDGWSSPKYTTPLPTVRVNSVDTRGSLDTGRRIPASTLACTSAHGTRSAVIIPDLPTEKQRMSIVRIRADSRRVSAPPRLGQATEPDCLHPGGRRLY